tara:strand:+ start:5568 stop:5834 length:267 start_codon:yes stop_codon:yes gene_type:complete
MTNAKRNEKGLNMNINLDQCDDVTCAACGNLTFRQVVMFKKVSAVYSPTGKASLIPLQVFECSECGHVNDEFIPKPTDKAGTNALDNG